MNFLTSTEIAELKAIRATYITDADLTELKDFFNKYGLYFTNDKAINTERTYKMIFDNFDSSRELNGFTDDKILKLYTIASTMDINGAIKAVADKAFTYLHDYSFESEAFILDNNFDFSPYLVANNESPMFAKTNAINVAIGTARV